MTLLLAKSFFIQLSLGLGAFVPLVDTQQTGEGFAKLVAAVCLGASLAALVLMPGSPALWAAAASWAFVFARPRGRTLSPTVLVPYLVRMVSLAWALFGVHAGSFETSAFFLVSALLLGIVSFAMVLGHWYLVVPRMSEKPLRRALSILWVILVPKFLLAALALREGLGSLELFESVLLVMRLSWGYLAVGVMGVLVWRLVGMRSLQSATGILYAMTFLTLGGELAAGYVYLKTGLVL